MMTNSEDPEALKQAERRYIDMLEDIGEILKTARGRRWIYELIHNTCHTGRVSHVPNGSDDTAFNEGGRAVGLNVLEEVKTYSQKLYLKMLEENMDNG